MARGKAKNSRKPRKEPEYRRAFKPHMVRKYTDADRVAALICLDKNKGNVNATAVELGIPQPTMWQWANGSIHPEAQQLRIRYAGDMQRMARELVYQCMDSVADEKALRKAPLAQRVKAMTDSFSLMRTLEGKPSSIHVDSQAPINPLLDLSKFTPDELESFLALYDKLRSANGGDDAGGTSPRQVQALHPALIPGDSSGESVHPGPGDGSDHASLPSGPGGTHPPPVDPDATRDTEVDNRDGSVPTLGVD